MACIFFDRLKIANFQYIQVCKREFGDGDLLTCEIFESGVQSSHDSTIKTFREDQYQFLEEPQGSKIRNMPF